MLCLVWENQTSKFDKCVYMYIYIDILNPKIHDDTFLYIFNATTNAFTSPEIVHSGNTVTYSCNKADDILVWSYADMHVVGFYEQTLMGTTTHLAVGVEFTVFWYL